nr:ANTAR domain-containing protein [Sedimentibacter sp.]
MDSVLIVSGSDKSIEQLSQLINTWAVTKITSTKSSGEARRLINTVDYDLALINTPLSDEFGDGLATSITEMSSSGVILIIKNEIADEISAKVSDYGVLVVSKPISRQLFYQALKLAVASKKRMSGLISENNLLQKKIEEIRLVTRAKCVLIQYLNMTEEQAHRYIEKQAMDMRTTRKDISQNILKNYET